jgi:hypothetical protein
VAVVAISIEIQNVEKKRCELLFDLTQLMKLEIASVFVLMFDVVVVLVVNEFVEEWEGFVTR